ncbi:MAG: DUF3824 domain-containing protein [Firmicutes bacterium]|nr:DUF3824 domain-containing protein [Bacillota bacterium]
MQNTCSHCGAIKMGNNAYCWQCGSNLSLQSNYFPPPPTSSDNGNLDNPTNNNVTSRPKIPPQQSDSQHQLSTTFPPPPNYFQPYYTPQANTPPPYLYNHHNPQYYSHSNAYNNQTKEPIKTTMQIVLGVINIIFGLGIWISFILGIIAIVMASGANSSPDGENKIKTARILNIIGLSIIGLIILAIVAIILIVVILESNSNPNWNHMSYFF